MTAFAFWMTTTMFIEQHLLIFFVSFSNNTCDLALGMVPNTRTGALFWYFARIVPILGIKIARSIHCWANFLPQKAVRQTFMQQTRCTIPLIFSTAVIVDGSCHHMIFVLFRVFFLSNNFSFVQWYEIKYLVLRFCTKNQIHSCQTIQHIFFCDEILEMGSTFWISDTLDQRKWNVRSSKDCQCTHIWDITQSLIFWNEHFLNEDDDKLSACFRLNLWSPNFVKKTQLSNKSGSLYKSKTQY